MSKAANKQPQTTPGGPMGRGAIAVGTEKAKDFKGTGRRLIGYFRARKVGMIFVLVAAALSTIFAILSPKLLGNATTVLFNGSLAIMQGVPGASVDLNALVTILVWLTILYILSALFAYFQQYIMARVAQNTVYDMREEINGKIAKLPLNYFDTHTNGETLSRITNDIETVSTTLQQTLTQLISSVIMIVGVVIMMLTINMLLTAISVASMLVGLMIIRPIISRAQKFFIAQQRSLGQLNGHIEEMYTGHNIVKAFGQEQQSLDKFQKTNDELYQSGWKSQFISGILMPILNFVGNVGYVLITLVGGILAIQQVIQIGDIQAFIQYSRQLTQPINQIANITNIFQSTLAAAERVFELLDELEELADPSKPVVFENIQGNVAFNHVDFGYSPDNLLMRELNINIQAGQKVAIVGPTGAGKTTLVNLLMRFYETNNGAITIDGVKINDISRHNLRQTFGMVLQDTWLFTGSIRDNLAYGKTGASDQEIIQAAKSAHVDEFVRTMPEGYDTVLNEDATNISQGQKQLLTIARALLADPKILILDEATSSVDTRTELLIQRAMETLMQNRTSFVIAHRLSTIKDADLILVMKQGTVVESGTHDQLLAATGLYAELYNSQFEQ
ncbi:MAG: ABC transporter ATP-binding protein [Culicoidibacterales bacterium]